MSRVYYNEIDPYAVAWLHNLMVEGVIAPGDVDTRSIEDVTPNDLSGYTQCHFFAGIGVWSYALRLAGWPDDRPVWTGSCPCQPFSQAGKGGGFADERHLWPAFEWLIGQRRPPVIFGEQVASPDGLAWLDLVQSDVEGTNHAFGKSDICAAGVGAPHIRQRLYWLADNNNNTGRIEHAQRDSEPIARSEEGARRYNAGGRGQHGRLGNANDGGGRRDARTVPSAEGSIEGCVRRIADGVEPASPIDELGHHHHQRLPFGSQSDDGGRVVRVQGSAFGETEPVRGFWSGADWIACRDGKWRPVEPGSFPLVDGAPSRVGRLRAYGNAINAQQAKEFIGAYLDI